MPSERTFFLLGACSKHVICCQNHMVLSQNGHLGSGFWAGLLIWEQQVSPEVAQGGSEIGLFWTIKLARRFPHHQQAPHFPYAMELRLMIVVMNPDQPNVCECSAADGTVRYSPVLWELDPESEVLRLWNMGVIIWTCNVCFPGPYTLEQWDNLNDLLNQPVDMESVKFEIWKDCRGPSDWVCGQGEGRQSAVELGSKCSLDSHAWPTCMPNV